MRHQLKIGYKIVGKDLKSLTDGPGYDGQVQYGLLVKACPRKNCGPMAVFDNLRDVESFQKKYGWKTSPVFKCLYQPSKFRHLWVHNFARRDDLPYGTRLADYVILLEEVKL